MKFIAKLQEFKKYLGMDAEIRNKKGDLLDSVTINNKGKNLKFNFDKDDALNGKKKTKLTISFTDTNGADGNLRKSNGDLSDLSPDSQTFKATLKREDKKGQTQITLTGTPLNPNPPTPPTPPTPPADTTPPVFTSGASVSVAENIVAGTTVYTAQATDDSPPLSFSLTGVDATDFSISAANNFSANVTINSSPDFETKSSYAFNVVAIDNAGNTSVQDVSLAITDVEEGVTVDLTPQLDIITTTQLSSQDDTVQSELGTLGNDFEDSITDGSTTDTDILQLKTNGVFTVFDSLDDNKIARIQNIETLQIEADNDDEGFLRPDLGNIVNLKKLDVDGTFTNELRLDEWAFTGATTFDFSGITSTNGVDLDFNFARNENFAEDILFIGSPGADDFDGLLGDVTMRGGQGNDDLTGSRAGQSHISGGAGTDDINLFTHNAKHTVSLARQTSETSKDTIQNNSFQGFNNANANALNTFDLIEIDAVTFTNHTAGQAVQQEDHNNVNANTSLSNTVVTAATQAALELEDFSNNSNGNGILGFAADTGIVLYSASGNFSADAQELLEIGAVEGPNFVPVQQFTVI